MYSIELGARIFHPTSQYMSEFITAANLQTLQFSKEQEDPHCVWDGNSFVFQQENYTRIGNLKNALSLFWKYSLSPHWISRIGPSIPYSMFPLYDAVRYQNKIFRNVDDLLYNLEVEGNVFDKSFVQYLIDDGYDRDYIEDIVDSLLRVRNPLGIHQKAISGMFDLHLSNRNSFTIKEGMYSIIDYLQTKSNARVLLNTKVDSIKLLDSKEIQINYSSNEELFDIVIIATPLYSSDIQIEGVNYDKWDYTPIFIQLVLGKLNPSYFNSDIVYHKILTTGKLVDKNENLPFTSILSLGKPKNNTDYRYYQITSQQELPNELVNELFIGL